MLVRDLLAFASIRLAGDAARLEAEMLLAHALRRPRAWLYAHGDDEVAPAMAEIFETLVRRRVEGEPVAYLTGERGFWSFALGVDASTLVPRPETERLVELALDRLPPGRAVAVADLGTGSGAIALAIAHERPRARVLATDASAAALAVAQANARRLGRDNVAFREGDWCAAFEVDERFDLIASNPPYIAEDDPHLETGDLRHEPRAALVSGRDGLDAIRRIVTDAPAHLVPGGWLLLEHGHEQGSAVRGLLAVDFTDVFTATDLEGRERISGGRRHG